MATVAKRDAIRPLAVKGSRVGVSINGGPYQHLVGASVVGHTAGTDSVEQTQTLDATGSVSGSAPIEGVSVDISAMQPQMPVMVDLQRARKQKHPVRFRWDIYSKQLLAAAADVATGSAALAIEADDDAVKGSLVTFAGAVGKAYTEADLKSMFHAKILMVGDLLLIGNSVYVLNRVEEDDTTGAIGNVYGKHYDPATQSFSALTVAVAAAVYSVRTAGARWDFGSSVTQLGGFGGDAGGDPAVGSVLMFQPVAEVALPAILSVDEAGSGW